MPLVEGGGGEPRMRARPQSPGAFAAAGGKGKAAVVKPRAGRRLPVPFLACCYQYVKGWVCKLTASNITGCCRAWQLAKVWL